MQLKKNVKKFDDRQLFKKKPLFIKKKLGYVTKTIRYLNVVHKIILYLINKLIFSGQTQIFIKKITENCERIVLEK